MLRASPVIAVLRVGDASSRVLGCAGHTPHSSTLRHYIASLGATPAIINKTWIITVPRRCFRHLCDFTAKENRP